MLLVNKFLNIYFIDNSDLIACTVVRKQERNRRFLVVDLYQIILVKPDSKKLGWGVVTFSGYIQV